MAPRGMKNYLSSLHMKPSASSSSNRKKKASASASAVAAAPKAPPKRRVFFVEERNTVREFEAVDSEDLDLLESLWQQGWEMHSCKQEIKIKAKQWRQTGMGLFLNDVYHCNDSDSNPTLCQKQLNTLAQLPDEMHMRGVERYLSRKHDQERTTRKRSILRDVVSQYNTLQTQVERNALSLAESQTMLSHFARRLNHDAEAFARRIGKADELVARKGAAKTIQPAQELLDYLHHVEIEKMRMGTSNTSVTGRAGQLKKAPASTQQQQPVAFTAGRRLQARQA